tara:strand:- start:874 stop:2184 length:1311 start_codon:yes stop_codon:yes gene_type:complete
MGYIGRQPTNVPLTSSDIADSAVSTAKLAPDAVTTAKIAPATVASSDIAPATIAASNIAPGTITSTQIAPATVAASNIAPATITQDKISPAVNLGIDAVTSNPPSPSEGDVWLRKDLSTAQLKAYLSGPLSWSTGGDMHNAPNGYSSTFGCGTQNDATTCGGYRGSPAPYYLSTTQSYDGSSWSTGPAYPTGITTGIQSSCGAPGSNCWFAGGYGQGGPRYSAVNHWNGSSHSAGGSLPTATNNGLGQGSIPSGFVVGGDAPSRSNQKLDYNGTSWATGTVLPTTINEAGGTVVGTPTNCGFAGGRNAPSSPFPGIGYKWDGSAWSTFAKPPAQPSTQQANGINFGYNGDDFYITGYEIPPGYNTTTTVEKWNGSAWSSATAIPSSRAGMGSATHGNTSSSGSGLTYGGTNPSTNNPGGQSRTTFEWSDGLAVVDI